MIELNWNNQLQLKVLSRVEFAYFWQEIFRLVYGAVAKLACDQTVVRSFNVG